MLYGGQILICLAEVEQMKRDVRISARIPRSLKALMEQFVARDAHINESDLIRDAIREKIQRDAPELYQELFKPSERKEAEP